MRAARRGWQARPERQGDEPHGVGRRDHLGAGGDVGASRRPHRIAHLDRPGGAVAVRARRPRDLRALSPVGRPALAGLGLGGLGAGCRRRARRRCGPPHVGGLGRGSGRRGRRRTLGGRDAHGPRRRLRDGARGDGRDHRRLNQQRRSQMTTTNGGNRYGTAFLGRDAPDGRLPESGMEPLDALRLVSEELVLDGIPMRNLATFVTTWMEPEAQRIIAENLHRNYIDHAEYPQTAEIEQRCIRMLADLYHAPGETTGTRTQGSSEAIMLGALSLKWKWRARREAAGKGTDRPNLVFGGDVHVVWEKFCRYFDVEPRIIPLQKDKYTIGPEDVEPHVDENTIGVAAVLGTTFTGHADDIVGINDLLVDLLEKKGLDVPLHVDAASGGFVWPFLYPHTEWDFRLDRVRSINVSGHKYGLVYPGIGWLVFRETSDLAEDLVFYENYLGKRDATFTLNFSTGSAMVLAQYYNFV